MEVKIDILTIDLKDFNTELKGLLDIINSLYIDYYLLAVDEKICVLIESLETPKVLKQYVFKKSVNLVDIKKDYQKFVKKGFITFKYNTVIKNENDLVVNNVYDITYKGL